MPLARHAVLLTAALALASGCGGPPLAAPVDPADAGRQLAAALDAWKAGAAHETLTAASPPVYFNEPLWKDGTRLTAYELGTVEMHGRQARCTVKLSLKGKDGKASERKIGYQIDTTPQVVIAREGLGL